MSGSRAVAVHWSPPVLAPDRVAELARWRRGEVTDAAILGPSLHGTHPESDVHVATLARHGESLCSAVVRDVRGVSRLGAVALTLVGSLTTRPEHRGRGLASELLEAIVTRAACAHRDAVWAWAAPRALFERAGFFPAGAQLEFPLGPDRGIFAAGIRPAEARDLVALADRHAQKPLRVDRPLADVALAFARSGARTYVLDRHRQAVAYACLTTPPAGPPRWIEFGGSDEDVNVLVRGATEALDLIGARVVVPPYRDALVRLLAPATEAVDRQPVGLRCALTAEGRAETFLDPLDAL